VTEIPEHLLKRSKAAKAKADGAEAPAEAASLPATTSPAASPAAAKAAAPAKLAPTAPPPPKPDPPYIAAAKARPKIPFWAMATLSTLPLWVFMYARGLTPKEPTVHGPLGDGAKTFTANCSGCHGAAGQGGLGYQFSAGEVLKTFPHIEDQLRFVYSGSLAYSAAGIEIYGNPEREGGPHITQARGIMPAQGGSLSESEILGVVCHERFTLGGADPTADYLDEYEKWCSPEAPAWTGLKDGSLTFDNIAKELPGTFVVGTKPLAGHAPGDKP
jgi:mono/diheme cytochrome c family protein